MYFNDGKPGTLQGVVQAPGKVGESPGVHDDARVANARLLHHADECSEIVGLLTVDLVTKTVRNNGCARHMISQGSGSINGRFARSQKIQVGTMEQQQTLMCRSHGFRVLKVP